MRVPAAPGAFLVLAACAVASAHAAEHVVVIGPGLVYSPSPLEIDVGDVVRFTARQDHPLDSDEGLFSCVEDCSVRFEQAGEFGYHCRIHGGPGTGMAGRITVRGAGPPFVADARVSGIWFDPETPGQGVMLEVLADGARLALGWFTWSAEEIGRHDWFAGLGALGDNVAHLDLLHSRGGRFAAGDPVSNRNVGRATLRFESCDSARLEWQREDLGRSGSLALRRLTPSPAGCRATLRPGPG